MLFATSLAWLVAASGIFAAQTNVSPSLPFTIVQNAGQEDSDVLYIATGPDCKALFREDRITFQSGTGVAVLRFRKAGGIAQVTATEPASGLVNYFRGSDHAQWYSGLRTYGVLEYKGLWPGIVVRFSVAGNRLKGETLVESGTAPEDASLEFEGDTAVVPNLLEMAHPIRLASTIEHPDQHGVTATQSAISPILLSGYFGGYAQTTITGVAINSTYNIVTAGWTLANNLNAGTGAQKISGGNVDAFVAIFSPSGGTLLSCTYLGGSGDDRAFALALDSQNYIYVTGWTQSKNFPTVSAYQTKLSGVRDAFVAKLSPNAGTIMFSTYLGGGGVDSGNAIVLDGTNAPVVVGDTTSTNLPVTAGAAQGRNGGGQDAFVAKLTSSGSGLTLMTYYGGTAAEHATCVTLDGSGNIYFAGSTYSQDFPVVAAQQPRPGGGQDAFVAKLAPDAKSVGFATYLGGSGGSPGALEQANALIFSVDNRLNVVGSAASPDFPITSLALQATFGGGNTDGFYSRYDPTGKMTRSTFLGGSSDDAINAITADYDGYFYLAGNTTSSDFPVKNAAQSTIGGSMDAFLVKMASIKILYSTFLGGAFADSANGLAVDSMTSVVVAGLTASSNFPVSGGIGGWQGSQLSSFITKITPPYTLGLAAMPTIYSDVFHTTGFNGAPVGVSTFGQAGDIPLVADWDGTGVKRLGVFRNGMWLLDTNGNGVLDPADKTVAFGQAGDLPVVGDWNGTGRNKLGLFRQGTFILDLSGHLSGTPTGLADLTVAFGQAGDLPVVGDWTQSGTTKIGVFRSGTWLLDTNGNFAYDTGDKTYTFGQSGDVPVVGDWSGSGTPKIGVYRNGLWILDYDGVGFISTSFWYSQFLAFGGSGYQPLVW
jgi:hypothetical protein